MQPDVQFARADDAVRIAWTAYGGGAGTPLVAMRPPQFSHIEREWAMPFSHHEYSEFTAGRTVIRFDPRGSGMSDRDVQDHSLQARLLDLEAVLNAAGLERVILDAISSAALGAIAFTAQYPERVEKLVVQNAFADGRGWWDEPNRRALLALADIEWTLCSETWAWLVWNAPDNAANLRLAEHIRACMAPSDFQRAVAAERDIDLRPMLGRIQAPALVLSHPRFTRMAPPGMVSDLAAAMPSARLVTIASARDRVSVISDFIDGREVSPPAIAPASEPLPLHPQLSERELEVLRLLVQGLTNREIADQLVVGVRTIDTHVAHIYEKTGTTGRATAAAFAIRHHLL